MKKLSPFLAAAFCLAASASAFAGASGGVPFNTYSAASAAVTTSNHYSVRGFKTKTLTVSGVTLASSPTSISFQNMSGTVVAECAPATSGPWSTCVANDYAQTAARRGLMPPLTFG
jgi:polyisoprenoid-binding protein YceI